MSDQQTFSGWAIVELFGHNTIAGMVSEQSIGGASFVRVDVPQIDDQHPAFTKLYGAAAIYAMTPVTEEHARAAAHHIRVRPVQVYILPDREASPARPQLATAAPADDFDDDDWDDDADDDVEEGESRQKDIPF
jgi:hypothetical protein